MTSAESQVCNGILEMFSLVHELEQRLCILELIDIWDTSRVPNLHLVLLGTLLAYLHDLHLGQLWDQHQSSSHGPLWDIAPPISIAIMSSQPRSSDGHYFIVVDGVSGTEVDPTIAHTNRFRPIVNGKNSKTIFETQ